MRKSFKTLVVTFTMLLGIIGGTLSTFAINDATRDYIDDNIKINENGELSYLDRGLKSYITTSDEDGDVDKIIDGFSTTIYLIDGKTDADLDAYATKRLEGDKVDSKISDITTGLDVEADTSTAALLLSGFTPILSTALGLMVILITTGMTLFSAVDLCYIAFPVFRNKCEDAKQSAAASGHSNMGATNKGGETKIRFVSDDAQYAVNISQTTQTGKNPFIVYFGKRLISYIVLAILLFILLTGNITIFTDLAIKAVSGILELIQTI